MNKSLDNNPWLSWSSYTENDTVHRFVGRRTETNTLFTLIESYTLVTLYGRSGSGKSSLLRAGVFPLLRVMGMIPVSCRFDNKQDCLSVIRCEVEKVCSVSPRHKHKNSDSPVDLYSYLTDNIFSTPNGNQVIPVIVMDQFEDSLRNPPPGFSDLLRDINNLLVNTDPFNAPVRLVISIREDYLYLLEDEIDNNGMQLMKDHRMRLQNFTAESASEVLGLDHHLPSDVCTRLMELSAMSDGRHSPVLLSFYCHELYRESADKTYSNAMSLLADGSSLLESYYDRITQSGILSNSAKKFIENHMQTNGLRTPVDISVAQQHIDTTVLSTLLDNGPSKLLQKYSMGESTYVELIHDKLAEVIDSRTHEADNTKMRHRLLTLLTLFFIVLFCIAFSLDISIKNGTGFNETVIIDNEDNLNNKDYIKSLTITHGDNTTKNFVSFSNCPELRCLTIICSDEDNQYVNLSNIPRLGVINFVGSAKKLLLNFSGMLPQNLSVTLPKTIEDIIVKGFSGHINFNFADTDHPFLQISDVLWRQNKEGEWEIVYASANGNRDVIFPKSRYANETAYYISSNDTTVFRNVKYLTRPYHLHEDNNGCVVITLHQLTDLVVPDSIKYISKINNASLLRSITISESTILNNAAVGCDSLKRIILGDRCSISAGAFWNCPSLQEVIIKSDSIDIQTQPISLAGNYRIILPDSTTRFNLIQGYLFDNKSNEPNRPINIAEPHPSNLNLPSGLHQDGNRLMHRSSILTSVPDTSVTAHKFPYINPSYWRFMGNQLAGIKDIYLLSPMERHSLNKIPIEIRGEFNIHIPYGTLKYFNEEHLAGFRNVTESTRLCQYADVISSYTYQALLFWNYYSIIIIAIIIALCLFFIVSKSLRRLMRKLRLYLPIVLIGTLSIYWLLFLSYPSKYIPTTAMFAIAVFSLITVTAIVIWTSGLDRREIASWFKSLPQSVIDTRSTLSKHTKSIAKYTLENWIAITISIIILAGVIFITVREFRIQDRINRTELAILNNQSYEAARLLPTSRSIFPSANKRMESLTDSILNRFIQNLPLISSCICNSSTIDLKSATYYGNGFLISDGKNISYIASNGTDTIGYYPNSVKVHGSDYISSLGMGYSHNPLTGDTIHYSLSMGDLTAMCSYDNCMIFQTQDSVLIYDDQMHINAKYHGNLRFVSDDGSIISIAENNSIQWLRDRKQHYSESCNIYTKIAALRYNDDLISISLVKTYSNSLLRIYNTDHTIRTSYIANSFLTDQHRHRIFIDKNDRILLIDLDDMEIKYSFRIPETTTDMDISPNGDKLLAIINGKVIEYILPTQEQRLELLSNIKKLAKN